MDVKGTRLLFIMCFWDNSVMDLMRDSFHVFCDMDQSLYFTFEQLISFPLKEELHSFHV